MIVFADRDEEPNGSPADRVIELPPSAKFVYKTLLYEGPLTQSGLVEETWLSRRTLRHALDDLKSADLVTEEVYLPDARKRLYRPAGDPPR